MDTAIVTGATGKIGFAVSQYLSSKGIKVLCIGSQENKDVSATNFFGNNCTYLQLDLSDIDLLYEKIELIQWQPGQKSVFFHFAWRGNKSLTDGTFNQQMLNVNYAANSVVIAKKIGCIKFVNCGSLEETFCEKALFNTDIDFELTQLDYALAKLASRDLCKIIAYIQKIDYVHSRLSVPITEDLSASNYIEDTLRRIRNGEPFIIPKNQKIFDFISLKDVAMAYFQIGLNGINKANYYIGTSTPSMLSQYFDFYQRFIKGQSTPKLNLISEFYSEIFDTTALEKDTQFKPNESFYSLIKGLNN
jgi:nucleoside-diphosphate-sugar epimerase